jgi:DNA processing protein
MRSLQFSPNTESDALAVLSSIPGLTGRRIYRLIEKFGTASAVFSLSVDDIVSVDIPQAAAVNVLNVDAEEMLLKEMKSLAALSARRVTIMDDEYPSMLRNITDAPVSFYMRGSIPPNADVACAVVGSRFPSLYGMEVAERFSRELTEAGMLVVSGMAKGIDTAAHQGALKAGGYTIAVLGSGLDVVYPSENKKLYDKISERGCVISEFPFGTQPDPFNFPRRNRIVSGLCLGVLVVEANIKSGALITARLAGEQGREIFAVPGRVDSKLSQGPHALIKQGAKVVLCIDDILEELPVKKEAKNEKENSEAPLDLPSDEKRLYEFIKEGNNTFEALMLRTGLDPASLFGPLLSLEIRRLIKEKPGKIYELYQ